MKIKLEKYNPQWVNVYNDIKVDLCVHLKSLSPIVEHIGSTSIADLVAKPIIDILVGVSSSLLLDSVVAPLISNDYIFYEKFNHLMPYRRFFVKLKTRPDTIVIPTIYYEKDEVPNELNDHKLAHIHILEHNSFHWTRHIAFREYLRNHVEVKNEYQAIKIQLGKLDWRDGNEYNAGKEDFIKRTEKLAIDWYDGETDGQ